MKNALVSKAAFERSLSGFLKNEKVEEAELEWYYWKEDSFSQDFSSFPLSRRDFYSWCLKPFEYSKNRFLAPKQAALSEQKSWSWGLFVCLAM